MERKRSVTKEVKGAERSAYFARREAAKVLRCVLRGSAQRMAVGSIKSLVYKPSVRNKKATFALVCQTLKCLPILQNVLETNNILAGRWKKQAELLYIIAYDVLFGQGAVSTGDAEKFLLSHRNSLQSSLVHFRKENSNIFQNLLTSCVKDKPRYVRVNTLKIDMESACRTLRMSYEVKHDDLIQDLLVLPPGTDLHDHPLVLNGALFLQGKASCMPAIALNPSADWEVLDACAAPGNKTVQLAALMEGRGKIIACELDCKRLGRLKEAVALAGASNVDVLNSDFLMLDPNSPTFSKVQAVLLDPSCSGSGISSRRLDNLLPSNSCKTNDVKEAYRLEKLAGFQKRALLHALSFPAVEKVVYSTCSVNQCENEDVIHSVLPYANAQNFHLEAPFPEWQHRGIPVFEGAQKLLRTEAVGDTEGFFIALFVRKVGNQNKRCSSSSSKDGILHSSQKKSMEDLHGKKQKQTVKVSHVPKGQLSMQLKRRKKSILFNLFRKGFGAPKMFRLFQISHSSKIKSRELTLGCFLKRANKT
eukprot:TRINITY_DN25703_c0_g1_i2.p1 TRINITY_DN25703_c0_g1~~TRINITY_DN25703_c0_g1_i2.p1  ORF type:complete len:558 (-),score=108.42 TRINITY_DN25703_c0_g1_i2:140-1738(-)